MTNFATCKSCHTPAPKSTIEKGACMRCRALAKAAAFTPAPARGETATAVLGVNEQITAEQVAEKLEGVGEQAVSAELNRIEAEVVPFYDGLYGVPPPMPPAPLPASLADAELASRELSRRRLLPFIMRFEPDYMAGWVHKVICAKLEQFSRDVAAKKSPRLMLFMPPRTGKSLIASTYFPSWHLGMNPSHEFILTSYSGNLAMNFSRKIRGILRDEAYTTVFPGAKLSDDSQSAEAWQLVTGGGLLSAGVGGGITGRGAHVAVIDDPIRNWEDAESFLSREGVWDWYTSTLYTRLSPGGGVLVIQTRWHDDDLSGRLEKAMRDGTGDDWEVIRFPAIAVEDEKFRKQGAALHPERYDEEALRRIERAVGPRVWQALYQQNPVPEDGTYFTRKMFRYYEKLPDASDMRFYATWDLAIGLKEANDFTAGVVVAVDREDNIYVVHVEQGRWESTELVEKILDVQKRFNCELVGIEKGHIEMAIGPYLNKRIRERKQYSFALHKMPTGRRDKTSRARSVQGRMEQGKIYFPQTSPWFNNFFAELLQFPNGKHDDQVDAFAYIGLLLESMVSAYLKPETPKKSWTDRLRKNTGRRSAMSA